MSPSDLMTELRQRWRSMFDDLAGGADVPPTRRLRAEGMMEAARLLGIASEEELVSAMDACYLEAFGRSFADDLGAEWRQFHPFPEIPAMGARAPVYPGTRE